MQDQNLAKKIKIEIDGEEIPGLVSLTEILDEEGLIEVSGFSRKVNISDGVKMLQPIDVVYKVERDTQTLVFFRDWYYNDERHDVTFIFTDATAVEVDRLVWPQCENTLFSKGDYDAGGVAFYGITSKLSSDRSPIVLGG